MSGRSWLIYDKTNGWTTEADSTWCVVLPIVASCEESKVLTSDDYRQDCDRSGHPICGWRADALLEYMDDFYQNAFLRSPVTQVRTSLLFSMGVKVKKVLLRAKYEWNQDQRLLSCYWRGVSIMYINCSCPYPEKYQLSNDQSRSRLRVTICYSSSHLSNYSLSNKHNK